MTTRCVVRAALTEERSKAEISLGFAVSRRQRFPICEATGGFSRRGKLAAERSEAVSPSVHKCGHK